jgi:hypothetical protein
MINEFDFIAGKFFYMDVPKEQKYLLRYFKTRVQRAFLYYKMLNGEKIYFTRHTGFFCHPWFWTEQSAKLNMILEAHSKAKRDMDLVMLDKIERGKLRPHGKFGKQ